MAAESVWDRFSFYRAASQAVREEIRLLARVVRLEAGEFFYRKGDICPVVALVSSGDIRVFAWGESGREISLYHVTDGHTCLVNLLCAYLNSPSPASAQAETRVEAWIVPAERFRQWVRNDPALVDHVFAAMADRVVDLMTLVEEISFRRMDERLSVYLAGQFGKDGNVPRACTATHEQIAAELGTAREVISRLLKDFERRGAVRTGRGRIELMNEAQLARSSSAVADRSD